MNDPGTTATADGHPNRSVPEGMAGPPLGPDRLVGKGHRAGDLLEAWKWRVLERGPGLLVVEANLPEHLKNPQGQLFGGFTAAYVDFVALHTVHSTQVGRDPSSPRDWLATLNLRCDYFEPITEATFTITGEVVNQRGAISMVSTSFHQREAMAAYGLATLRRSPIEPQPDGSA